MDGEFHADARKLKTCFALSSIGGEANNTELKS